MWTLIGRYTWEHGAPPMVDVFSYATPGQEFLAHSWLVGLVFFGIEQSIGAVGFMGLRFALISVALCGAVRTARLLGAPWPAILLLTPVVLTVMWGRLEMRPQLHTTAFLSLHLWLLVRVHLGRGSWGWLWGLPPVYALWINLHGGWPQGIAMLIVVMGALVGMQLRRRWLGSGATSHLRLWPLMLVLGACGVALLANPYGWRLVHFPLDMQADWIRDKGSEWSSPWANPTGWEAVGGGRYVPIAPAFFAYLGLLAGVLVVSGRRWRTMDLLPVALMGFWGAFALYHLRAVSDATLLTAPLVAAGLGSAWWQRRRWPVPLGIGLTLTLASTSAGFALQEEDWSAMCRNRAVQCLAAAIERQGVSGRVFSHELNHWLLYRFHPRLQVHRTWDFVAGEQRWRESGWAWRDGTPGLQVFLDRYQVEVLIMTSPNRVAIPDMREVGWEVTHLDDHFFLMVRRRPETAALIRREGYRHITLGDEWTPIHLANAAQVHAEADRALRHCPEATWPWPYKAAALSLLGAREEAHAAEQRRPSP